MSNGCVTQNALFSLWQVPWETAKPALSAVREAVFVHELNIPTELEWDGKDPLCTHILAEDAASQPIGTGRLLPQGQIGRMAVLKEWRGRRVGSAVLAALIQIAQAQGITQVTLHAQTRVWSFYRAHEFIAVGEEFLAAGIPHRKMVRRL